MSQIERVDVEAGPGAHLGDARAHQATAHDADTLDLAHQKLLTVLALESTGRRAAARREASRRAGALNRNRWGDGRFEIRTGSGSGSRLGRAGLDRTVLHRLVGRPEDGLGGVEDGGGELPLRSEDRVAEGQGALNQ